MLANELIDRLERLGLLDQEIIEALREQLVQGGTRVTPEAVAKLLVDNGHLTRFQATKLIGELRSGEYESAEDEASALTEEVGELEILSDEEVEVVEVEPEDAAPVYEASGEFYEADSVDAETVAVVAVEAGGFEEEASEVDVEARPRSSHKKADSNKSQYDSFKIYGYIGIIVALLLIGSGITFVLTREDADQVITNANEQYDNQNYDAAQKMYVGFLESFGDQHQYSSMARARITMTELYKAATFKQEPWQAVELEKEKLPLIADEEGMNEERGNLAALMVDIAANLADSASRASETEKKQSLLTVLDEQLLLMENPQYMMSSMKVTLASQIQNVVESRARVQRDISRNMRLDEAEASMIGSLDQSDTKAAYDTRKQLLQSFPELYDNERLETLIKRASEIQQTLVNASSQLPKVTTDESESVTTGNVVLTSLAGGSIPDLRGETLYFRAGGSILAIDGESGRLAWRKYVGAAKDLPPVQLEDGVLLSQSSTLEILRCSESDGSVAWRSGIDENFSEPIAVKDDIFVATESGRLIAFDAISGDAKWATQLPQELNVGPGIDDRLRKAYLAGGHSNLYVLNSRDGSCVESYYLGHESSTISVAPVPLLGHVFVIENAGADYANVHVLRVDERGESLVQAQAPFRLIGNVIVDPIVNGRRLIVLTDRGEVTVYDIEPTAEREQVTVAATLPAFYEEPTATQMAVGKSQMWITGTRLGRYELQINTGRVIRDWSIHELDTFLGKPYASDEALVHARVLRDTSAIRITAANPKTGEEIWRTDVGVPVSLLQPTADGIHVVTTQAALFDLQFDAGDSKFNGGQKPLENPGDRAVAIRFSDPIKIDENRSVMLNEVGDPSLLIYDPNRETEKLRRVTMRLDSALPTSGGVASGGGLLLPLDSGRVSLVDWRTGAESATPFQPPSDPVGKVQWTKPIALPDDADQVVLADSRKKIYRLRVGEQIRELQSKDLEFQLIGPSTRLENAMVASTAGPAADFLVGFDLTNLSETFRTLLNGRINWGPSAAGDIALIRTDDGNLRAHESDGTQRFEVAVPTGGIVGEPLLNGEQIILAGRSGWIVVIDSRSGDLLNQIDLGQPISSTPIIYGGGTLLVPGAEGVVYSVEVPK
ncbi:MAG: PQQ-binding-like beta-propeller repeat protein [Rubripirellula sp.]|nr:PQQ-binding-like beta-propeller repeat protein [Rubripirellula sp.]